MPSRLPGPVLEGQQQGVEVRLLVGPLQGVGHRRRQGHDARVVLRHAARVHEGDARDGGAGGVQERRLEGEVPLGVGRAGHRHVELQGGVAVPRVEVGHHPEVRDVDGVGRPEHHVAEDPGQPPEVLGLEVGAVGEAIHLDGEEVLPRPDGVRDVELGGPAAVLAVADLLTVHPEVEAGGDTLEGDPDAAALPGGRHLEAVPVGAHVVLVVRHAGRRAPAPGVADVHVERRRVAVLLDVRRDRDRVPRGVVEGGLEERLGARLRVGREAELPPAVQEKVVGRLRAVEPARGRLVGEGVDGGVGVELVEAQDLRVLPVGELGGPARRGMERVARQQGGRKDREDEASGEAGGGGHGAVSLSDPRPPGQESRAPGATGRCPA